jgi:predicted small metal-binding protein
MGRLSVPGSLIIVVGTDLEGEGELVAKMITCADSGMDCPGQFRTETEEELWKHVELHVQEAHPDLDVTPELKDQVGSLIRDA